MIPLLLAAAPLIWLILPKHVYWSAVHSWCTQAKNVLSDPFSLLAILLTEPLGLSKVNFIFALIFTALCVLNCCTFDLIDFIFVGLLLCCTLALSDSTIAGCWPFDLNDFTTTCLLIYMAFIEPMHRNKPDITYLLTVYWSTAHACCTQAMIV